MVNRLQNEHRHRHRHTHNTFQWAGEGEWDMFNVQFMFAVSSKAASLVVIYVNSK